MAAYIAMPLYLCGFLVLGAAVQKKLSVGALVMGWGLDEVAVMVNTTAVCESISCSDVLLADKAQTRTATIASLATRQVLYQIKQETVKLTNLRERFPL